MRLLYAVLLLLAACTAPQPTTYERGTFTRSPPAPTRPGVGLPQPHMPGQHVAPQVQPNPRPKRYLPPEPDGKPGIWGTETPRASKAEPVTLLDITIPTPPEATEETLVVARLCAYWYAEGFINNAAHARRALDLTKEQRLCLMVDIMKACMRIAFNPDMSSAAEADHTRKVLAHMNDSTKKTCGPHRDAVRNLASSIMAVTSNRWNKMPQGPIQ